jgi:hypothetical protein
MNDEIPLLTSYSNSGVIYAWHAWFSSRVTELSKQQTLDGLPVDWLTDTRKKTLEFMKHINEDNLKPKLTDIADPPKFDLGLS